jgi:hypothetical protein
MQRKSYSAGSPAADRRKEGDFVAVLEQSIPGGEFLVAGGDERRAEGGQFTVAGGVVREDIGDCGAFAKFDGIFAAAEQIFNLAEEENSYANGLGDGWHTRIVTRAGKKRER